MVPPLLSSISQGGSPEKKKELNREIIAKGFSYPHTEFGALRSRRLAVKFATNKEMPFFSDPCVFGYIF